MAFVPLYGLNTAITAATAAGAGQLKVDNNEATAIAAQLGANFTYASLSDGVNYEIVRIDSVTAPFLNVTRGQDGTTTSAFPQGACLRYIWNSEGIIAVAGTSNITLTGAGAVAISGTYPNFTITVPIPTITGTLPIEVLGAWPAWEIGFQGNYGGCCCGGSGGGSGGTITEVTGSGLANVTGGTGPTANIDVPVFNPIAGANMTITGTWPNITFASSGGGGGGGVATVTGSAKIVLSGTPTNPVINLVTTGAGGTYNGVTYDAWGTITAVNSSYIPITTVTSGNPLATITYPTSGTVDITYAQASTTDLGLVKMAPPTVGGTNNPSDSTSAVSPAGINAVIGSLAGVSLVSSYSYTADLAAAYTNTAPPALTLGAGLAVGHVLLITATCEIVDTSLGAGVSPAFGMAIFNGATLVQGIKSITGHAHTITFTIPGPLSVGTTYTLKTTALSGTTSIVGAAMTGVIT